LIPFYELGLFSFRSRFAQRVDLPSMLRSFLSVVLITPFFCPLFFLLWASSERFLLSSLSLFGSDRTVFFLGRTLICL